MKKLLRYLFLVLLLFVNVKAKAQFNGYWEDYSKGIYNISGLSDYFQRPLIELLSPEVIKQIKEIKITAGKITPGLCKDIPNLSKVTISDATTIIAESAFRNCHSLKIVDIPESVTMISFAAFMNCDSISSLYIPESVTEIADSAFYACRSLKNINIPNGVTILRTYVFAYTGLTNITIPQSVSEIYVSTFQGCHNLTSVNIPNSISSISSRTFFDCKNLTSVNIPNSVRRIEKEAFRACTSLTSITLPKSLVVLERGAFDNCSSLRSVNIPNSVTRIESETFRGTGLTSVNIPNGVISIGDWAFDGCTSLTSITLPKSVAAIGKGAFYNCDNIESVNILSEGEIEIGPSVFEYCTSLKYVNIPNGEPNIGNQAFQWCNSLKGVSIPNGVISIGDRAFDRCGSLTNLIIPKVKSSVIGDSAFYDCTSLTSIIIPEGVRNIGNSAFLNCSSLTNVDIPESVTHIGECTFLGCSSLISVNIPNGVKNIGVRTFKNCSSLISVNIPDSVKSIYIGAFENCTSLTSIIIPNSVVEGIGNDAFYGCTNLKTVFNLSKLDIVKGSERYGHVAYYADEVITDGIILSSNNLHLMTHDTYKLSANTREGQYVTWSSSDKSVATVDNDGNVTAIGVGTATITATTEEDSATCKVEVNEHDWLFNHTTGHLEVNIDYQFYNTVDLPWYTLKNLIKSVKIGKRAEFIARYLFADCSSLTSVTISEGIQNIGSSAFIGCSSLSSITLPKSLRIIRDGVFKDCSSLTSIIIPDSVVYIGEKAFEGCTNLKTVINKSCLDIVKGSETHGHVAYYADTVLTGGIIFNNTPSPLEIRPYETYSISVIVIPDEMRITWSSSNESVATVDQNGKVTAVGEGIATITATAENYSKTLEVRVVKNWWFDPHTGCLEVNNWSTNYDESDKYPWYKYKDSIKSVRIGSIETLGACAFKGYPSLTTVTISGHIREIKENAFKDCPSLRSVNMPNRVDIISSGMFEGCYSLTNVTMPNSMYEIPENMFKGCSSLTSIKIPDIAKYINSGAFEGCSSLTNITIPNSVDQIRDNAFKGCTSLKTVINLSFLNIVKGSEWYGNVAYYAEEVKTFGFKNKKSSMPKNGTSVLPGTWPSNGVVTFSSSDESVATVDNNGKITTKDKGTTIITATTEYGSVTCEVEVFNHFFNSETGHLYIDDIYTVCPTLLPPDSIKSIEFSSNVTRIGYGAFKNCSSLTSITLPKSLVEFGREAFYNCSSLTSIIIPDSVEIIGEKAFEGCTNLKTVINFSSLDIVKGSETHGHVAYYAEKVLKPGIELNYSELSMAKGDSFALSATIIPEMPVTWSSSANSIATVDQNGNVTAVGVGTATITATAGNYSATCKVTVTIPVSGIILSQDTISLMEGKGMTLSATVLPDSATDKTVKWSSSDISIATVNRVGRVIGKGVGTATITATAGDYSATCVVTVTKKPTPVSGITLSQNTASIVEEESMTLLATVLPDSATDKTVTWSSSADSIATVDQNGNVTALRVGTATITATAGNYSATCEVTVTKKPIPVSGIILSQDTISLMEGKGMTLSATVLPDSATDKTVEWSSSDISVATVNRVGRVIGKGVGTATITATAGDYSATCVVTVTEKIIYVSNIILSQKSASLIKGEGMTLIATVLPENAVDNSLTWSSSDESVATVDHDGNVTATGMGTATIKATAGKCSATCNVTVSEVCYMKNVGAGLFLAGGNAWGTQSSFAENGLEVTITKLASGKCIIDTKVDNSGSHYLGTNGYVDAAQAEWSIELQSDGTYTITNDSINYIGYDGSTTVLNMQLKNATDANARWQFITRKELLEEISTATEDSPQNATILLGGADFSPNDTRNNLWSDNPALGGYRTEIAANHCGEKWNTATFDVAQTLTNIPNGYYKISVQGFYRMGGDNNNDATIAAKNHAAGTEMLNAVFYANNEEKELMSIISGAQSNTFAHGNAFKTTYGYVPQDMSSAAAAFTDGKYDQSIWVEVTDGTLRLGVKKEYESTNDWTIFDNFRVVYYGVQQPNAIEEIKATINSRTNDVYDLSGRLVRRQGEGLEGLKAGIYIINGKKYIVK